MTHAGERALLPFLHELRAALRVGRILTDPAGTPIAAAHLAYTRLPTDGIFAPEELVAGESLLVDCGLIRRDADLLVPTEGLETLVDQPEPEACRSLIFRALDESQPVWISAATSGGQIALELVPDGVGDVLASLWPDPLDRELFLLNLGRRFDERDLAHIGEVAEECVAAGCREELQALGRSDLALTVRRLSVISDQLGYDVTAPRVNGSCRRLEVKGTRSQGPEVTVILTRNEVDVASRDPDWSLVICIVSPADDAEILGWCEVGQFAARLPRDPAAGGTWRTAAVRMPVAELHSGLPPAFFGAT